MVILTTQQTADMLGISRQRILQLIYAKRLPAQKFGDSWMIREDDIEKIKVRKTGRPRKHP